MKGFTIRIALVFVLAFILVSCSTSSPTETLEPNLTRPTPRSLSIIASTSTSKVGSVTFKNDEGVSTTYTATESASWLTIVSGGTGTLAVNQTATLKLRGTCGATPNQRSANVTITSSNDVETVRVTLYCSAYNIQLVFNTGISNARKLVFRNAATRWSQLVVGDIANLPLNKAANACGAGEPAFNATVDDLVIYASVEPIDGPGNVLGSAGPCLIRNTGGLTVYGVMRFDSADVAGLEAGGTFDEVILHEMGHVLGIGSFWQFSPFFNLINYAPTTQPCRNTTTFTTQPKFTGANAKSEYATLGGSGNIPVENQYSAGTKCVHWDEETFDNELMTGFLGGSSSTAVPLSRMTVGSLADLGYQVNKTPANPYTIPSCSPACLRSDPRSGINLAEQEIILTPIGTVGLYGAINLIKK